MPYQTLNKPGQRVPVKTWTEGVPADEEAMRQLSEVASLPFIYKWVAGMPDLHVGIGATVGSVIPTQHAIIPAAVGVDIGCGMIAVQCSLKVSRLPDTLNQVYSQLMRRIPVGKEQHTVAKAKNKACESLAHRLDVIFQKHPQIKRRQTNNSSWTRQMGTLGGGNHFIELCADENDNLWIMLHSGSRGVGNAIGSYFIELAKYEVEKQHWQGQPLPGKPDEYYVSLPNKDLAYLTEGSTRFDEYIEALLWAQDYAAANRHQMLDTVLMTLHEILPPFNIVNKAINCHHNYAARETHYGETVWVTRKGAIHAGEGELGIIPGSMGTRSYIVRGKGNAESFHSCSHGAGRLMSRGKAKQQFSIADHMLATEGVICRKDIAVLDETPAAYKDIDAVMRAQSELVDVVHTLKQILCIKG